MKRVLIGLLSMFAVSAQAEPISTLGLTGLEIYNCSVVMNSTRFSQIFRTGDVQTFQSYYSRQVLATSSIHAKSIFLAGREFGIQEGRVGVYPKAGYVDEGDRFKADSPDFLFADSVSCVK